MCRRNKRRINSNCNRNPSSDGRLTSLFLALTVIICYYLSLTMTMVDAFIIITTIPRKIVATKAQRQSQQWVATTLSTSLTLSSSLHDDDDDNEYFFTAPDFTAEETIDHSKTISTIDTKDTNNDLNIASREQSELESMTVNDKEHEHQEPQRGEEEGQTTMTTSTTTTNIDTERTKTATTTSPCSPSTLSTTEVTAPSSSVSSIPNSMSMDVDGNGTGGLMKRSHTGGGTGTDATLMVTSMKTLAFPIDSGKDGMEADDTKRRTRTTQTTNTASEGTDKVTGMRLVRYTSSNSNLPTSKAKLLAASSAAMITTTTKKLVLAPAGTTGTGTTGGSGGGSAMITKVNNANNGIVTNSNSRLIRYNGPDLDDTTDYDGMEKVSTRNQRQREIQLSESNLVMYNPTTNPDNKNNNDDQNNNNNNEKQQKQKHRPTLTKDIRYSIQYIEKTDFTMARKTGLAVNKPISLWIERDKFL